MIEAIRYELDKDGATIFKGKELGGFLRDRGRRDIKLLATQERDREETQSNIGLLTLAAFAKTEVADEHYHLKGREFYIVIRGSLKVHWGKVGQEKGKEAILEAGDCFVINRYFWHSIEKVGEEELFVYTFKVPPDTDAVDGTINGKVEGKD